jgi:chloramphenicol 3-O phosphotransferase
VHTGKIIFLHGASSSGKSTIAKLLQNTIDEPFWHVSIDHLIRRVAARSHQER